MSKSKRFDKVKYYYDEHFWNKTRVGDAVKKNWITPSEYFEIVGELYDGE